MIMIVSGIGVSCVNGGVGSVGSMSIDDNV